MSKSVVQQGTNLCHNN